MHKLDFAALISTLVGACSVAAATPGFDQYVSAIAGPQSPKIIAVVGIIGLIGGQVLRIKGSPSSTQSVTVPKQE